MDTQIKRVVSSSSCATVYELECGLRLRYFIIVTGIPALEYDDHTFPKRFDVIDKYNVAWDRALKRYPFQKDGEHPNVEEIGGQATIDEYIAETYSEKLLSDIPLPESTPPKKEALPMFSNPTLANRFRKDFDMPLLTFTDRLMTRIRGSFSFDVIAFDGYCHEALGYSEDEHGSLNDFITAKSGKDMADFLRGLL